MVILLMFCPLSLDFSFNFDAIFKAIVCCFSSFSSVDRNVMVFPKRPWYCCLKVIFAIFMLRVALAVLNRKGSALSQKVNLTLGEICDDDVIDAGVFAVLVHLFEACITFLYQGFSLLCNPEWLIPMYVCFPSSN